MSVERDKVATSGFALPAMTMMRLHEVLVKTCCNPLAYKEVSLQTGLEIVECRSEWRGNR